MSTIEHSGLKYQMVFLAVPSLPGTFSDFFLTNRRLYLVSLISNQLEALFYKDKSFSLEVNLLTRTPGIWALPRFKVVHRLLFIETKQLNCLINIKTISVATMSRVNFLKSAILINIILARCFNIWPHSQAFQSNPYQVWTCQSHSVNTYSSFGEINRFSPAPICQWPALESAIKMTWIHSQRPFETHEQNFYVLTHEIHIFQHWLIGWPCNKCPGGQWTHPHPNWQSKNNFEWNFIFNPSRSKLEVKWKHADKNSRGALCAQVLSIV